MIAMTDGALMRSVVGSDEGMRMSLPHGVATAVPPAGPMVALPCTPTPWAETAYSYDIFSQADRQEILELAAALCRDGG